MKKIIYAILAAVVVSVWCAVPVHARVKAVDKTIGGIHLGTEYRVGCNHCNEFLGTYSTQAAAQAADAALQAEHLDKCKLYPILKDEGLVGRVHNWNEYHALTRPESTNTGTGTTIIISPQRETTITDYLNYGGVLLLLALGFKMLDR